VPGTGLRGVYGARAHAAIEVGTAPAVDALVPLLLRRSGALDEGDVNSAFVETVRMLGRARVGDRASTVALPSADGDLAEAAAARLQAPGLRRLWVVEGGIDGRCFKSGALESGWKAARLPLVARPDARQLLARGTAFPGAAVTDSQVSLRRRALFSLASSAQARRCGPIAAPPLHQCAV